MMTLPLTHRVAIVTGGSSGIGRAVSHALAAGGARVAVVGRSAASCARVVAEIRAAGGAAMPVTCDVGCADAVARMVQTVVAAWGGVDILINNAGIARGRGLADSTPDDWQTVISTNLNGSFFCAHAVYPHLQKAGRGHIIMLASQAAGWPGAGEICYGTSKTAQVKLALHILDEFRHANQANGATQPTFFCHAICPGGVDTPWPHAGWADRAKMLRADDVAALVTAILEHPDNERAYYERAYAQHPTVRIGPVGIFEPHPNIIRIWHAP
jgi:3-oxoacyl-[acyl-carrier protein] reductase